MTWQCYSEFWVHWNVDKLMEIVSSSFREGAFRVRVDIILYWTIELKLDHDCIYLKLFYNNNIRCGPTYVALLPPAFYGGNLSFIIYYSNVHGETRKVNWSNFAFFDAIISINLTGWVDLWLLKNWLNLTLVATDNPWMNHSECVVMIFSPKNKKKTSKLSKSSHKGRNTKKKIRMSQMLIQIIQQWGVCACVWVCVTRQLQSHTLFFFAFLIIIKDNSVDT